MTSVTKWYAGIGSRKVPKKDAALLQEFAYQAARKGLGLRSGAAIGCDAACELGAIDACGKTEIFLPWRGYERHPSQLFEDNSMALDIAKTIHPAWGALSGAARKMIARNMQQITGQNLDTPVEFVICWTPDGCESKAQYSIHTGGTGSAIALASTLDIPVFNIRNTGRLNEAQLFLESLC